MTRLAAWKFHLSATSNHALAEKLGSAQIREITLQEDSYDVLPTGSPTIDAYEVNMLSVDLYVD